MSEERKELDMKKEGENLKEKGDSNYWKPTAGKHSVVFLSEGTPKVSEFEGKEIPKAQFSIEVGGEQKLWDMTRGQTKGSLYGQVVRCCNALNDGKAVGLKITLFVQGSGKETRYTVMEAVDLEGGGV